jgi:hypothetical protein
MAGAKYTPGFDDPSARPKLRTSKVLALIAAALVGAALLGGTFLAYLSPSLMVDLGSMMLMCAQMVGLR